MCFTAAAHDPRTMLQLPLELATFPSRIACIEIDRWPFFFPECGPIILEVIYKRLERELKRNVLDWIRGVFASHRIGEAGVNRK